MLDTAEITIRVSAKNARVYEFASDEDKEWLQAVFNFLLDNKTTQSVDLFGKIMDEISDRAIARGLTPEILESILDES